MPTKTTVTVQAPSRASATKAPHITVNTGDAKSAKTPLSVRRQIVAEKKNPPPSTPQTPASAAPATAPEIKKPRDWTLFALACGVGLIMLCLLVFFAWKGLVGVSSEAIAKKVEKTITDEQGKNRTAENDRASNLRTGLSSLEKKIDDAAKDGKDSSSKFVKRVEELEKGMVALVDAVKDTREQSTRDTAAFRKENADRDDVFRKQMAEKVESIEARMEKVESIATRIETRLKEPVIPKALPITVVDQEGSRAVAASSSKHFRFEGEELRPGEMSKKYCIDDIKAGKIEISNKPGIIARNHLYLWRTGWIDTPVPSSGTYVASPDAKFVSFFSLTETFTVKRIEL